MLLADSTVTGFCRILRSGGGVGGSVAKQQWKKLVQEPELDLKWNFRFSIVPNLDNKG
jgi:hypothetical protein